MPSLLDHPLLARRYFYPRPARFPHPHFVQADGAELACCFNQVDGSDLTVVHFHGNGEVVRDWMEEGFAERFASLGASLLLAEYRGYGMSTGVPALGKMLDDVEAVIRAADQPPERIVVFGRSVGSLFAIHAVHRFPEIAGLILESGIADPLERLLLRIEPRELDATPEQFAAEVTARLDHRRKLAGYRGPVLVMHTLFDDLVPATNADRLAEWAGGPVATRLFQRGYHNTILAENAPEYFEAVGELLATVRARQPG